MRTLEIMLCIGGMAMLVPGSAQAVEPSPRFAVTARLEPPATTDAAARFALDARLRPIESSFAPTRFALRAVLGAQPSAKGTAPACAASANSIFSDGFETGVTP